MTDLQKRIAKKLLAIGMPAELTGYEYIKSAVEKVYTDRTYMLKITKMLYPEIAADFNTTPSRVECAIRHAVKRAKSNGSAIYDVLGPIPLSGTGNITNSAFIGSFAEALRMEE
jgi:two-component system, response regulator, stage 0 sporulation protein A